MCANKDFNTVNPVKRSNFITNNFRGFTFLYINTELTLSGKHDNS